LAKAKGTILLGVVKYLRKNREQALRLLPPELHHYLSEKIFLSAWYPEEHLIALIRARLRLHEAPEDEALAAMGRLVAQGHAEGVYSRLLERGGGGAATEALWSSQHDTGTLTSTRESRTSSRIELIGYAHPSREMCRIVEAYMAETIRFAGMAEVSAKKLSCAARGDAACSWRFTWIRPVGASDRGEPRA
jgi:hypothetical protein